jgi:predicted nucleotidyltransferase
MQVCYVLLCADSTAPTGAKNMNERLLISETFLKEFCRRHHIRRLALFGSRLKGRETPESDIDLLVEFEPGHEPGLLALAGMELELSDYLGGIHVDLRTPSELSRYFRDEVLATAETQYAA